jgi:hypothetical protein
MAVVAVVCAVADAPSWSNNSSSSSNSKAKGQTAGDDQQDSVSKAFIPYWHAQDGSICG